MRRGLFVLLLLTGCASVPSGLSAPVTAGPPVFNLNGARDVDGFYVNPTWDGQTTEDCLDSRVCDFNPISAGCNNQKLPGSGVDTPEQNFFRALKGGTVLHQTCTLAAKKGHVPGHINIAFATFEGALEWTALSFDGDYDLELFPVQGGLTAANPDAIHLEFLADETLSQFDDLPAWWRQFRDASLRVPNRGEVEALIGERPLAVIKGLFGFDCEHGCYTELHPIYVMALRREPENGVERWAIMVRNWGTEGWCSSLNHGLPARQLRVLLPYPSAAFDSNVQVDSSTDIKAYRSKKGFWDRVLLFFKRNTGEAAAYNPQVLPGRGVLLAFDLPDWRARGVIVGELNFRWSDGTAPMSPVMQACIAPVQPLEIEPAEADADEQFRALVSLASDVPPMQLASPKPTAPAKKLSLQPVPESVESFEPSTERPATQAVITGDPLRAGSRRLSAERVQQLCAAIRARGGEATNSDVYREVCKQ